MGQVTREASADAFGQVTGRRLVQLPPTAGRTDSEVFFEALGLNAPELLDEDAQRLLAAYNDALARAFEARRDLLTTKGRPLPGAKEALTAVARLPGVLQTVLTGTIRPNAIVKLRAFGLDGLIDAEIGGFGSDAYPKGTLIQVTRLRAAESRGVRLTEQGSVYIGDSPRDVDAARVGGARSIAVVSGRATRAELAAARADAVLADLADTDAVVRTIDELTLPARSSG